jgi:hypothetical protein
MQARIAGMGGVALPGTPGDFRKLIAADIVKWGAVVKRAGITVE